MLTVATFAQPTVLLTNDDGPDSPFFQAWVPYVRDVLGCAFLFCTYLKRAALSISEFETVTYESLMAIIVLVSNRPPRSVPWARAAGRYTSLCRQGLRALLVSLLAKDP